MSEPTCESNGKAATVMAVAALVASLGGTPAEADAVIHLLYWEKVPLSPGSAMEQVQAAIESVRESEKAGPGAPQA